MTEPIIILVLQKDGISDLIFFLKQEEIDSVFIKPLSKRTISVEKRVMDVFLKGNWIIATQNKKICGCRGIKFFSESNEIHFTTFVVSPLYQGKGIGRMLFDFSHDYAIKFYSPSRLYIDSWAGNKIIHHFAITSGFKKVDEFKDKLKRPNGVNTVIYELVLTN